MEHEGESRLAGHYLAYVRDCNDQWWEMNDAKVTRSPRGGAGGAGRAGRDGASFGAVAFVTVAAAAAVRISWGHSGSVCSEARRGVPGDSGQRAAGAGGAGVPALLLALALGVSGLVYEEFGSREEHSFG